MKNNDSSSADNLGGVAGILKNLLDKLADARCIIISSLEGAELYSGSALWLNGYGFPYGV